MHGHSGYHHKIIGKHWSSLIQSLVNGKEVKGSPLLQLDKIDSGPQIPAKSLQTYLRS